MPGQEIERYHRLAIATLADGSYRIEGTNLDLRLCLLHWLRRALRLCPHFISHHFTPAIKTQLKQLKIARNLYDETNLQALVNAVGAVCNGSLNPAMGNFYASICSTACYSIIKEKARSSLHNKAHGPAQAPNSRRRRRSCATGSDACGKFPTITNSIFWRCFLCC
ncbi:stationary phase inducible protein CsiE [Kluyvera cryocrescens]|uniref:Stationary phase inducible protein CsiE n=1 Tax=Kluyvera cryocrescens TaxID=580 RepID=A0A485ASE9_KLUCR|nr:stationary phase inducible protein CsiE [Kluyvera cryocrescens]